MQPLQDETDRRDLDQGLANLHSALVVLAQAAVPQQPRESPLYYPPLGLDLETFGLPIALNDL